MPATAVVCKNWRRLLRNDMKSRLLWMKND
jgi:hypothetical protein